MLPYHLFPLHWFKGHPIVVLLNSSVVAARAAIEAYDLPASMPA